MKKRVAVLLYTILFFCSILLAACSSGGGGNDDLLDNNPPVAFSGSVSTAANTAVAITLKAQDNDDENLVFIIDSYPKYGILEQQENSVWKYLPNDGFNGKDSFTFLARDTANNKSNLALFTILVGSTNQPPLAPNQSVATDEDASVTFELDAYDPDGDLLSYTIVTGPANGTYQIDENRITYVPDENYFGQDILTYFVNDGIDDSNPVTTVYINVGAINDRPRAIDGSAETYEDTPVTIELQAEDVESSQLTYMIDEGPHSGQMVQVDGTHWQYIPDPQFCGNDSFTFYVKDESGNADSEQSESATVSITVTPVPDAPVAYDAILITHQNTNLTITLQAEDFDGDSLTYEILSTPAAGELKKITETQYSYLPEQDFLGDLSFTFRVVDSNNVTSNEATVIICVTPTSVWYVDAAAADGGNGQSWKTAFNKLSDVMQVIGDNEQVWIAKGTYTAAPPVEVLCELKPNITLYGGFSGTEKRVDQRDSTLNATVLDGAGLLSHVLKGADNVLLDGLILTGGNAVGSGVNAYGGALYAEGGVITIRNCVFRNNHALQYGGALYGSAAKFLVESSFFEENTCDGDGAAMYLGSQSELSITAETGRTIFSGNSAEDDGGAIYAYYATSLSLDGVDFNSNKAAVNGGALCTYGDTVITNTTFSANISDLRGGAVCAALEQVNIASVTFNNNEAVDKGGALYLNGEADLSENAFYQNKATEGGAIFVDRETAAMKACAFNGNVATSDGGAIYAYSAELQCEDLVCEQNSATRAGAIYSYKTTAVIGGESELEHNAAQLSGGAIYLDTGSYLTVKDEAIFSSNQAQLHGGALYNRGRCIMEHAQLLENNALQNGGAIYLDTGSYLTVNEETIFSKNRAELHGGALYSLGNSSMEDVQLLENKALQSGGALFLAEDAVTVIKSSLLDKNSAGSNGGALYALSGVSLLHSIFSENTTPASDEEELSCYGGAIYAGNTAVRCCNALFVANSSAHGGFLYLEESDASWFINCTIVDNSAMNNGGAVYNGAASTPLFRNCILWNNRVNGEESTLYRVDADAIVLLEFCAIGPELYSGDDMIINEDPLFVAGPGGSYYLKLSNDRSPCIDAGDPDTPEAVLTLLEGRTVRTDETTDSDIIDLGYHYVVE